MTATKSPKKLIMVTEDNNNKFYNMNDNGDGTFTVEYGRVGATSTKMSYPINKWDSIYRSKTGKGYKDVTEIFIEEKEESSSTFANISDHAVAKLVSTLQSYANKSVVENYLISSEAVTLKQIEEAQAIIDQLSKLAANTSDPINKALLELYSVIPRRMSNVKHHLFDTEYGPRLSKETLERWVANEQATLDVMRGQVSTNNKSKDVKNKSHVTILEAMGLSITGIDEADKSQILKLLGPNAHQFKQAYRVINNKTQSKFDSNLKGATYPETKLFWHGSRNENWWSILDTGLVLRPANAIINGKMFGYGIYFADKAQKSIGYTSLSGSYWTRGNSRTGYLAIFEVHTGKQLRKQRHESWMYDLNYNNLRKHGDYDSFFAEGGADLRNNEYIVYKDDQCTIKYLIEIG